MFESALSSAACAVDAVELEAPAPSSPNGAALGLPDGGAVGVGPFGR